MPYTRMWDNSTPLGTRDADEVDDAIREFKVDISERVSTLMGTDGNIANDPCIAYSLSTLKATTDTLNTRTGSITTGERDIPWFAGAIIASAGTINKTQQYIEATGASASLSMLIPVVLPVGVVLTLFRARILYQKTTQTITGTFKGTQDESDVYTFALTSPAGANVSPQWMGTSSTPSQATVAQTQYGMLVTLNNNNLDTTFALRFYGIQVQFTSANAGIR